MKCAACQREVSAKVESFSKKKFGKVLCMDCQNFAKQTQIPTPAMTEQEMQKVANEVTGLQKSIELGIDHPATWGMLWNNAVAVSIDAGRGVSENFELLIEEFKTLRQKYPVRDNGK